MENWEKRCKSKYATRPILYTDTLKGEQTLRDDLWAVTTEELNKMEDELESAKQEGIDEGKRIERDSILKAYRQSTGINNDLFTQAIETTLSAGTSLHQNNNEQGGK